ncbi:MAG: NUDIX domain-containing protein [Anaerolineae bacterium]|nr:NUDIX domain-containing protein [Anaerolineae bacterium]
MAQLIFGERIAREARLRPGCSAIIFDEQGRLLLTRRTDNGRWCLPGGGMDAGESAAEACIREVREETGLEIVIVRLIGVYSSPDMIVAYEDGNRWQIIACSFEGRITGGTLSLSDETTAAGFYTAADMAALDVMEHHRQRIADALSGQVAAFWR